MVGLVACGSSQKPAQEPSSEEAKPADEVPKWEGASSPVPSDESPKPKSGGTAVNEKPAQRVDQYDKEATDVVLKRAARQVKENCGHAKDENGKANGPWGKATLQVQLGHNGHSKGVTVPPPYQGKATGNCVEKAFSNLTFPPWSGSDAQIDWEVELVQPK
ncbi:hypothetical protein AKJ09_05194 [Labilithrix luteola]|uniref:TolA protein n=1 Tax=Labilithrix luteola TaxID=1391654 RepID=A0A0K1PYC6_9BACT|nr:hypothetical protein AKJ09_05194 [Labilithrix luteola]